MQSDEKGHDDRSDVDHPSDDADSDHPLPVSQWGDLHPLSPLQRDKATSYLVKVLVPDMPAPEAIMPYLKVMHSNRVYVNGGPIVRCLEKKLGHAVAVANATQALELALRARNLPRGANVLVPSVTFVASAQAIVNAGLTPVVVDVGLPYWHLTADQAEDWIAYLHGDVAAVMPVAAYGQPVSHTTWKTFARGRPDIAVVIDAAGALLSQPYPCEPNVAVVSSLHATKFIGAGEGGIFTSADPAWRDAVRSLSAFGQGGTNAKMSEYHAAVALASLDSGRLSAKRKAADELYRLYSGRLDRLSPLIKMPPPQMDRTMLPILCAAGFAERIEEQLAVDRIETKRWYAPMLHQRPEFKNLAVGLYNWPYASHASEMLVGIPFHTLMSADDVGYVCDSIEKVAR